jgi:hypothetical protein
MHQQSNIFYCVYSIKSHKVKILRDVLEINYKNDTMAKIFFKKNS